MAKTRTPEQASNISRKQRQSDITDTAFCREQKILLVAFIVIKTLTAPCSQTAFAQAAAGSGHQETHVTQTLPADIILLQQLLPE